jgi:drug/metabolite transporter (DMT)-like permease
VTAREPGRAGVARTSDRVALGAFTAVSVLAGGSGVAIRITLRELGPLWSATLRFVLASVVLVALMPLLGQRWPRGHQLTSALVFGVLGLGTTFALANYALQTAHAGLGQTVLALVPLATLLLAVAVHQERMTVAAVAGALLAVAGVGVVSWRGAPEPLPGLTVLAILGAVFSVSAATVVVRRFPPLHPVAMNAVAAPAAAVLLLTGAVLSGESLAFPQRPTTWSALAYIAVVGSVVVFSLQLLVLKHWNASRSNYVFVVIPLVAIPVSAWLDDEQVGSGLLMGAVLVLGGVYLGALRGRWHAVGHR